jgi:ubiquinone/menaquinone biosynthesis C-methylase UbiE
MSPTPHTIQRVFTTKSETKSFYDKIARFYDLLADESEAPMRHKGLALLAVQPGEHVLEVGFGTGHCLVDLAKAVGPTGKVSGIDISAGMKKVAAENLSKAGVAERVELSVGDGTQLPYPDKSFDAVFMSFTLELFDTPEIPKALAECRRVLKAGGRLGVVGVSKLGADGVVLHVYEWSHRHFPNLVDCRPIFVQEELEESGFGIASAQKATMWVPVEIVVGTNS